MYVHNPGNLPEEKQFRCNGLLANWLMRTKGIPLLSRTDDKRYIFARTKALDDAIKEAPLWLKVGIVL